MKTTCVVIGGGSVGLACARALTLSGIETVVLEREFSFGQGISSRNSEVIHSGIYYPQATNKSIFCIRGKKLLYDYLKSRQISFQKCGKLIVATSHEQLSYLHKLKINGETNNLYDLKILNQNEVNEFFEPNVQCIEGLLCPTTGIFNSHEYMESLIQDIELGGSIIAYNCKVEKIKHLKKLDNLFMIETTRGIIESSFLINCSGLNSIFVTKLIPHYPQSLIPKAYFAKGNYFKLLNERPFSRLIYPIPEKHGLGIHATLDLDGNIRFGPDVEWLIPTHRNDLFDNAEESYGCNKDSEYIFDYEPNLYQVSDHRSMFFEQIRLYYPSVTIDSIVPDYAGIRPKLCGPSSRKNNCNINCNDFLIHGERDHKINGLINLLGIESPGLTSSLALGEFIRDSLLK